MSSKGLSNELICGLLSGSNGRTFRFPPAGRAFLLKPKRDTYNDKNSPDYHRRKTDDKRNDEHDTPISDSSLSIDERVETAQPRKWPQKETCPNPNVSPPGIFSVCHFSQPKQLQHEGNAKPDKAHKGSKHAVILVLHDLNLFTEADELRERPAFPLCYGDDQQPLQRHGRIS